MAEVYVLTFPNGKQYVGRTKKTADVRFRNHVRDSQKSKMPVHRAIRKFGAENVKVAILADGLSWSEDVRRALGCEFDPKKEGQVWFVVETAVKALLMRGQNVILDCNSHTVKQRRVWLRLRDLANINFLSFPTPPEAEWKRRCQESNFKWSVIERMKAEYQPLTPGEQT